jgi:transposase
MAGVRSKQLRRFSAEFKREAVWLMASSGKLPVDSVRELGVPRNRLYKWKEQPRIQ